MLDQRRRSASLDILFRLRRFVLGRMRIYNPTKATRSVLHIYYIHVACLSQKEAAERVDGKHPEGSS